MSILSSSNGTGGKLAFHREDEHMPLLSQRGCRLRERDLHRHAQLVLRNQGERLHHLHTADISAGTGCPSEQEPVFLASDKNSPPTCLLPAAKQG